MCLFKMVYGEKRLMTHKQTNFQTVFLDTVLRKSAPPKSRRRDISTGEVEIKALRTDQTNCAGSGEGGGAVPAQYNYLFQCYYSKKKKKFWKCVNASVLTDVQTCLQPCCKTHGF